MSIPKATTKLEGYAIIAGMGVGYAAAHALAIVSSVTGVAVGLSAAAAFFLFWCFFEKNRAGMGLPVLINLRGLGGVLLGLTVGGTMLYKTPMVDGGLVAFALGVALFFFWRVKNGGEA
jgi:hypothetical protein